MAKPAPSALDPDALGRTLDDNVGKEKWQSYQCTLVTPMYGGGVKAKEVDSDMPIRATEIRGQLRYWWRLLNRNQDNKSLFEKERAIWGGLGDEKSLAASKVVIRVTNIDGLKLESCASYPAGKSYPDWTNWAHAYALFPAQGKAGRGGVEEYPAKLAREGLAWRLHIGIRFAGAEDKNADKITASIHEAFRWWATFGGVGARTRRGLGAVEVKPYGDKESFSYVSKDEVIQQGMALVFKKPESSAMGAWKTSVGAMQEFRQGVETGRNKGQQANRPGRSRWPEPPSIRMATGVSRAKSAEVSFAPEANTKRIFPRAAFGLPIIFHFQNERGDLRPDPEDVELTASVNGVKQERMASPLILRPYRDGNKWLPCVLKLPDEHVWNMDLLLENSRRSRNPNLPARLPSGSWWPADKAARENAATLISPMKGQGDTALGAFLKYFESAVVAGAAGVQATPVAEKVELVWEKATIKYNRGNGALSAEKDGKSATAIKAGADAILTRLPKSIQDKIKGGQFYRAKATVRGSELLSVEEQ